MKTNRTPVERKPLGSPMVPPTRTLTKPITTAAHPEKTAVIDLSETTLRASGRFSVRIDATIKARLARERERSNMSYTELLVVAFRVVGTDYRALIGNTPGGVGAGSVGPPPRSTPYLRAKTLETKDLTIYLDVAQEQWLQQAISTGGAPNRTALVEAVLDRYLPE